MRVYPDQFEADMRDLITVYQDLPSHPKVYVATPLPAYPDDSGTVRYSIQPDVIREEIRPIIERIAVQTGAPVIDLYPVFDGKPELYSDGLHPTAAGAALLAHTVYDMIS